MKSNKPISQNFFISFPSLKLLNSEAVFWRTLVRNYFSNAVSDGIGQPINQISVIEKCPELFYKVECTEGQGPRNFVKNREEKWRKNFFNLRSIRFSVQVFRLPDWLKFNVLCYLKNYFTKISTIIHKIIFIIIFTWLRIKSKDHLVMFETKPVNPFLIAKMATSLQKKKRTRILSRVIWPFWNEE